jgi:hypothetical protein
MPESVPDEYSECCNPQVVKTIQERAWSSPIWYRPEGVARLRGTVRFGNMPQQDVLKLKLDLGGMPSGLDPTTQDVTIALRDDDEVYSVTIPAGTLPEVGTGRFVYKDPSGSLGGIRKLQIQKRGSKRASLRLHTVPIDLSAADRVEHFIEVSLRAGTVDVTATPAWQPKGSALVTRN